MHPDGIHNQSLMSLLEQDILPMHTCPQLGVEQNHQEKEVENRVPLTACASLALLLLSTTTTQAPQPLLLLLLLLLQLLRLLLLLRLPSPPHSDTTSPVSLTRRHPVDFFRATISGNPFEFSCWGRVGTVPISSLK